MGSLKAQTIRFFHYEFILAKCIKNMSVSLVNYPTHAHVHIHLMWWNRVHVMSRKGVIHNIHIWCPQNQCANLGFFYPLRSPPSPQIALIYNLPCYNFWGNPLPLSADVICVHIPTPWKLNQTNMDFRGISHSLSFPESSRDIAWQKKDTKI